MDISNKNRWLWFNITYIQLTLILLICRICRSQCPVQKLNPKYILQLLSITPSVPYGSPKALQDLERYLVMKLKFNALMISINTWELVHIDSLTHFKLQIWILCTKENTDGLLHNFLCERIFSPQLQCCRVADHGSSTGFGPTHWVLEWIN